MKIALIGYGKMGKELEKAALSRGHEIVCIIDVDNQEDFESEAFKSADVAIEFTNPMVAYSNYMKAFKAGVKLVSGSTGWMAEHGEEIKKLCTEGGKTLFWSSNFSLGVAIFSSVNKYLAKIMNQFPGYDVTMSETHHIHKLDAPSGTAITLAEGILENMDRKDKWVKGTLLAADGTVSGTDTCASNEFPIDSIREGEVFGIHTIRYESEVDSISITHDAKNRGGFVLGAILAAEYTSQHEGYLGMSDLFPFQTNIDYETSHTHTMDQMHHCYSPLSRLPHLGTQLVGADCRSFHLRYLYHQENTLVILEEIEESYRS